MKQQSIDFLQDNVYLWEAQKHGEFKHLSELQAITLNQIAKEIKPGTNFQLKDCQDCHDAMVAFVYKHYEAGLKRQDTKDGKA